jgi:hypothetical protein
VNIKKTKLSTVHFALRYRFLSLLLLVTGTLTGLSPAEAYKWQHAGIDSSGENNGQYIALVVGADGRHYVSHYKNGTDVGAKNLKFATKVNPQAGGTWTTSFIDASAQMGSYSSITLAKSGPHVAYFYSELGDLRHAYYDSTSASWVKETVDAAGTVGQFTAISANASSNTISIAYFDATRPGLKLARKVGTGLWTFSYIDTDGTVGLYNSFNKRGDELAYYDLSKGNLKYAYGSGTTWFVSTVDSIGDVGRYASVAQHISTTFISYYDATNQNLKVAERFENGPWMITTVDATGDVGQGTSITVSASGRPVITYYDVTNRNLKYAERFNGTWIINTVATSGDVGRFSAVALDPVTELPLILYLDETKGVLRYARGRGTTTGVDEPPPSEAPALPSLTIRVRSNPVHLPAALDVVAAASTPVAFRVFDVYGRIVRNVFQGSLAAGVTSFSWDGRDEMGRTVGAGVYFASAVSAAGRATTRLVVVH